VYTRCCIRDAPCQREGRFRSPPIGFKVTFKKHVRRPPHMPITVKALSTLSQKSATICRRKVRLSQKSATVSENGETTAKFGDCRTFLRQALRSHYGVVGANTQFVKSFVLPFLPLCFNQSINHSLFQTQRSIEVLKTVVLDCVN